MLFVDIEKVGPEYLAGLSSTSHADSIHVRARKPEALLGRLRERLSRMWTPGGTEIRVLDRFSAGDAEEAIRDLEAARSQWA